MSADAPIGPGRLVLIVGPSGAGKDTLLALAREACAGDDAIVFARRVVTRAASEAEDHASLDPAAFHRARLRGAFALHWEAHGLCYGLPRAIEADLLAKRTVVANVSRTIVETARAAFADVVTVLVDAPAVVLAERLATRSRASDGPLGARLERTAPNVRPDVTVVNVGDPAAPAARLVAVLRGPDPERDPVE